MDAVSGDAAVDDRDAGTIGEELGGVLRPAHRGAGGAEGHDNGLRLCSGDLDGAQEGVAGR